MWTKGHPALAYVNLYKFEYKYNYKYEVDKALSRILLY